MTALLGLVCTVLSVGFVWPQVSKVYRSGTVQGLAPLGTLHGLAACTLWTLYGAARGVAPLVVSNVAIGAAMGLIAAAQVRHRSLDVRWLVIVLVVTAGVGAGGLSVSAALTGWAAIVVGVTSIVPQTVHVSRVVALPGVSLPMYMLLLVATALWATYGVLVHDWLVVITNVAIAPCAAFVALKAWRFQAGLAVAALEVR